MMSWATRAQRRGGITRSEFLTEMGRHGFVEERARHGMLHEFSHPDCGKQLFTMKMSIETYSAALVRLPAEARAKRRWSA